MRLFLGWIECIKIVGLCHDNVTARVCREYFTIGHPPIFGLDASPTVLAFGWGIIATWWVGVILSGPALLAARVGSRPKLTAGDLIRPVACLLLVMGAASLAAGVAGYVTASLGGVRLIEPLASRVPPERHIPFLADLWAHLAAYGVGFLGGIVLCIWLWRHRGRL